MESTHPALELASKHMTKLKSVQILCEIQFTHVFMKYSLWPKRFCLQVFDTKSLKFVQKFLFDNQKLYYMYIYKNTKK